MTTCLLTGWAVRNPDRIHISEQKKNTTRFGNCESLVASTMQYTHFL